MLPPPERITEIPAGDTACVQQGRCWQWLPLLLAWEGAGGTVGSGHGLLLLWDLPSHNQLPGHGYAAGPWPQPTSISQGTRASRSNAALPRGFLTAQAGPGQGLFPIPPVLWRKKGVWPSRAKPRAQALRSATVPLPGQRRMSRARCPGHPRALALTHCCTSETGRSGSHSRGLL